MGAYAPWDNATLAFPVFSSYATDPNTGNKVPVNTTETYVANVALELNNQDYKSGIDENIVQCKGKLLAPAIFSSKVKVGMIANCTVNGIEGTLRIIDIGSNELLFARKTLHQGFRGVFKQTGRGG
jgi:hypothetical protein